MVFTDGRQNGAAAVGLLLVCQTAVQAVYRRDAISGTVNRFDRCYSRQYLPDRHWSGEPLSAPAFR